MDHKLLNLEDRRKKEDGQKKKHKYYTFPQFLYLYQLLESMVVISVHSDTLNNSLR